MVRGGSIWLEVISMLEQTHFRVEKKEQDAFKLILANVGLTPNEAYKIFRRKTIESGGIQFEVSQPSTRLKEALKSKDYIEFDSAKEGFDWLND